MDVIKERQIKWYQNRKLLGGLAFIALVVVVYLSTQLNLGLYTVSSTNYVTAKVTQGDMSVKVSASGIMVSRDARWVASNVEARVERILLKPGDEVKQGQVVLQLTNPELDWRVQELHWEYAAVKKELEALGQRHKTQLLELETQVLNNRLAFNVETMRLEAESKLIADGNGTVSLLDYESRKLRVAGLNKTLQMDENRLKQLTFTLKAEYEAREARMQSLAKVKEQSDFQRDSLQVRAPLDGILQEMSLELGQRVVPGDSLAKFARKGDLLVELNVPELNVSDITKGQSVSIDTRFNEVMGKVVRIDPAVINGVVKVDVELVGELPNEARPDLSVTGEVIISEKKNTLYVRRPAYSVADKTMSVFRLNETLDKAEMTRVSYGIASSLDIEVVGGLNPGDVIIISETSEFSHHNVIAIED